MDSGLRRNDGREGGWGGPHPLAPSPTFGEGGWIPAFAGMTGERGAVFTWMDRIGRMGVGHGMPCPYGGGG